MIKVSAPELLIASSAALICFGHNIMGCIFASIGVIGALGRVIIETQVRTDSLNREAASREMMYQAISSVADSLTSWSASRVPEQFDDNEYN